jgi:hypothetical protein
MKPLLDFLLDQMLLKQEDLEPQPLVLFVSWQDFQQKPVDFMAGNRYNYYHFLWVFLKLEIFIVYVLQCVFFSIIELMILSTYPK